MGRQTGNRRSVEYRRCGRSLEWALCGRSLEWSLCGRSLEWSLCGGTLSDSFLRPLRPPGSVVGADAVTPSASSVAQSVSRQLLMLVDMDFLCLLLLFPAICRAIEVHVPDLPVTGILDEDVILPCWFTPPAGFSVQDLSVFWKLTSLQQVHAFTLGQEQLENQEPNFINRTQLFLSKLPEGNMSLLLRKVQLSDEGSYTCFVNVGNFSSAAVSLQVAASFTKPILHLEPSEGLKPGDQVTVTCHTYRGYPEAEILWQDGKGQNLTENITTSQVANEEGLFHVQSSVHVILETSDTYTCLVYNPALQVVTHASLSVTGQHLSFPLVALWVTVGLCVCLLGLLVALACVCRKQLKQTCEEEQEQEDTAGHMEQEENGELKTAMQPLKASAAEGEDTSSLE